MRSLHEVYILIALPAKEGFPHDSAVKNSSAMQEMWVRSLGWEDPLKDDGQLLETEKNPLKNMPLWNFPGGPCL